MGRVSILRIALAAGASAGVVLAGPVVGILRGALFATWPAAYVPVLAAVVALGAAAVLGVAWSRARHAHWTRGGALGLAAAIAVSCAVWVRTGEPNVDVVESFHFVEYSALTIVWAWALQGPLDAAGLVWAGYAGVTVGVLDEWYQWLVPGRTGEIRDVGINAVAVLCGVIVAAVMIGRWPRAGAGGDLRLAWGAVLVLVLATGFFTVAHLGFEIVDPAVGRFRSRYSASSLRALAADRAARWGEARLPRAGRFSREDQYLSEALWHVERRNDGFADRLWPMAWREQQIVSTYYWPILRVATADGPAGHALAAEHIATIRAGAGGVARGASDAVPAALYLWTPRSVWLGAGAIGVVVLACGVWHQRRVRVR